MARKKRKSTAIAKSKSSRAITPSTIKAPPKLLAVLKKRYHVATHKVPHPAMKSKPVAQALKKTWGQVNDACQKEYGTSYSGVVRKAWSKYK